MVHGEEEVLRDGGYRCWHFRQSEERAGLGSGCRKYFTVRGT